jgi:23S rRNA pseudouridine1911/1915/1917 synthase
MSTHPTPPANQHTVREETTLVSFLAESLGVSKSRAKDLLDARNVFVNDRRVWMAKHPLARGDRVRVVGAIAAPAREADAPAVKIEDIQRDTLIRIINKPAGMPTNEKRGSAEEVLGREGGGVHWLPVHRLDADTTGCLLFAASAELKEKLVAQFKAQTVRKAYEAVAMGRFDKDKFSIRAPLDGQTAVSHVQVLDASPRASLVRVEIETGRTHQIRRHLAGIGHPLAGDKQYAGKLQWDALLQQCPRHLLHARELGFIHPTTNRPVRVFAPHPRDFTDWCRKLGLTLRRPETGDKKD